MNFVKYGPFVGTRTSRTRFVFCFFLSISLSIYLIGCTDQIPPPSAAQLIEFENAGPVGPSVDMDRLVRAKIGEGPYRVAPGEVLELTMPAILQVVTAEEPGISGQMAPYICRISENGVITLPVVGQFKVAGKTLAEIESVIAKAYYPVYTVTRPSVFARIMEYKMAKVSVTGAVNKPGIYSLRSDQMSLVALLMEAEGIIDEGAAFIRIAHADQVAPENETRNIETAEEPVTPLPVPAMRYPDFDESEVQLTFKQPASSSTIGGLTIRYHEAVLLSTQIDIASEAERQAFVERLALRGPQVPTAEVNQRLCALAELLKPGSGTATEMGHHVSTVPTPEGLHMPTELLEPDQSMRITGYDSTHQSIASNVKLNTEGSGHVSAVDEVLYAQLEQTHKDLLGELDVEEGTKAAEQVRSAEPQEPRSLVLPVKGFNIPFADVALQDGDSVIVERLRAPMITVVGLVNRAGNFPYPPHVEYNLMQALGFAEGLNLSAEPRYATVYRLRADGTTISATFNIIGIAKSEDPAHALLIRLKPYDVVAVEHTPRTRAKVFWDRVFRFYVSTYIRMEDIFQED